MPDSIPERVAKAIEESGLEDDEIAPLVHKDTSTVYRWRNKKTKQYGKTKLKLIANALDVNYQWLRFGTGPKDKPRTREPKSNYSPDDLVDEAKRRLRNGEAPDNAEDLLLQAVLDVLSDLQLSVEKLIRLREQDSDD